MMAQNVLANFVQIFGYVMDENLRGRMFALDLLENFNRRPVWIDLFRGFGERVLFGF
jgi:hypothetical protein